MSGMHHQHDHHHHGSLRVTGAADRKLLAVGSPKRSPLFPDTPTLAETGIAGFDADSWFGFYAPAGLPADIASRLESIYGKGKYCSPKLKGLGKDKTEECMGIDDLGKVLGLLDRLAVGAEHLVTRFQQVVGT